MLSNAIDRLREILRDPHDSIRQENEKNRRDQGVSEGFFTENAIPKGRVDDVLSDDHQEGTRNQHKEQTRAVIRVEQQNPDRVDDNIHDGCERATLKKVEKQHTERRSSN